VDPQRILAAEVSSSLKSVGSRSLDLLSVLSPFSLALLEKVASFPDGVNLPYLLRRLRRVNGIDLVSYSSKQAYYIAIRRELGKLSRLSLITLEKVDGLLWAALSKQGLDLIKRSSKTQTFSSVISRRGRGPARSLLRRRTRLNDEDKDILSAEFETYLEDVSSRFLVLGPKPGFEWLSNLVKPYVTRFTSDARKKRIWKRWYDVWDGSRDFKVGVFVTLTSDPKRFSSFLSMLKENQRGFNRFMSMISRRLGHRPPYVRALEFSKQGFVHHHIVIFGVGWLIDKFMLTKFWSKYGVGEITYLYQVVNRGGSWVWTKTRPRAAKERSLEKYLTKYLTKGLALCAEDPEEMAMDPEFWRLALYWVTDSRFFTCSRRFIHVLRLISWRMYEFLGSYSLDRIPWFIMEKCIWLYDRPPPPSWGPDE